MRALALLALVLAGCEERRSFDERYDDAERNVHERADRLDDQLNDIDQFEANATNR